MVDENLEGISWEQGVSAPHQAPSTGFQCQEGKSPKLLAANTSGNRVRGRNFWSPKQFLLKNPHMDSPTQTHSLWAPAPGRWLEEHQGGGLRGTSGMQGEAEVSDIRRAEAIVPFLDFPPKELAD